MSTSSASPSSDPSASSQETLSHPSAPSSDEEALAALEAEFASLDGALVAVIYFDTRSYETARDCLASLAAVTSAVEDYDETDWASTCATSETDPTVSSMSSLRVSDVGDELDSIPDEEGHVDEMKELAAMFPSIKPYTLRKTLSKCGGDVARATDELLNRVFLDQDGETDKGVDGFGEEVINAFGNDRRQRRNKRKHRSTNPPAVPSTTEKSWDRMAAQVAELADTLHIPKSVVSSVYHTNGGKLAPTLSVLLDSQPVDDDIPPCDPEELSVLRTEFPEVQTRHLGALLRFCGNNMAAVFSLADVLRHLPLAPVDNQRKTLAQPSSRPQPPDIRVSDENWVTVGTSLRPGPCPRPTYAAASDSAAALASSNRALRSVAFTQAAAHYRRGKSDRLMAGAALYYSEIGREANRRYHEYSDRAAEEMVEANSSDDMLDLHGVTVPQAVRIAREKTTAWWVRVEAERERGSRVRRPFRIITGLGRHSKGGEAKLYPAVSKMLVRENWRISAEEGQIVVLGVKQ